MDYMEYYNRRGWRYDKLEVLKEKAEIVNDEKIIKVNFNPQAGHEQAGYRTAIVISNDIFNQKLI